MMKNDVKKINETRTMTMGRGGEQANEDPSFFLLMRIVLL
jgi:hypothetical protein